VTLTEIAPPPASPAQRVTPPVPAEPVAPIRRPSRSALVTTAIGVMTAVLYTWDLSSIGYGNSYYAAAVRSASVSWKAFLFGSLDPGGFITVDKPPAALWLQAISVRVFGFNSWAMLLPEALAGVASVLLLHHLVRRWAGDLAAHIAAIAFALTPVALLMFRYNNPDALLTFLGLAAAWALWRAVETGRTSMLVVSAALVGLGFQTKMLQAFLVLPAFVVVYLLAGPPKLGRRLLQLAAALAALVVSAGWWVAVVALWPASSRPYIGSTSDNSILSLVFGYNGLSRLFGGEGPGGGGGPGGDGGFGGAAGWLRLFNLNNGGQISWLLPFAAVSLAAGLWLTRGAPRTDNTRAGWLLWGLWAFLCFAVFSLSEGIFHEYYSVQLAPAVAALVGAGVPTLWRLGRSTPWLRAALAAAIAATAAWAIVLLDRTPSYAPWLPTLIGVGAVIAVVGLLAGAAQRHKGAVMAAGAVAAIALLAGPAAYAVSTIGNAETGAIVTAGPPAAPRTGGLGRGGFGRNPAEPSSASTEALVAYLQANRGDATYLVAAFGSQASAPLIIATGEPVLTIGGFSGSDPAPTLEAFRALVASGAVKYVLAGGGGPAGAGGGPAGAGGDGQSIAAWAASNGVAVDYGGTGGTLYDVSAGS
jgi:4-amino-4-deoxy-L-arabinose transferase-like glycosyltransferase